MNIYLDMDGVLVDFIAGYTAYVGADPVFEKGNYSLGQAYKDAYIPVEQLPLSFWEGLHSTAECRSLLRAARSIGKIQLITRATNGAAIVGKTRWAGKRCLGSPIICSGWKGAQPRLPGRNILVDDSEDEVAHWEGPSILIPRPWNFGTRAGDFDTWFANKLYEV